MLIFYPRIRIKEGKAMGMNVSMSSFNSQYSVNKTVGAGSKETSKIKGADKPTWNPNKVYKYLEDMNDGFQSYKKKAVAYYNSRISEENEDGAISVDELKEQIKEWFPEYTLTSSKPKDVVQGKFYLYIDDSQLKKMASDASYRAKVYGLMDSELQGKKGYTLQYSDGKNVTSHITGSIFSLCEENRKYAGADGIPYLGSCTSDHPISSSNSHCQVRSMSYLYDNIDPAKSAAKERKAAAAKLEAKRLAKRNEKKKAEKKAAEKKLKEKKLEAKEAEKKAIEKEELEKASDNGFNDELYEGYGNRAERLEDSGRKTGVNLDLKA